MLDATATGRITRSVGGPPTFVGSDLSDHACGPAFMQVPGCFRFQALPMALHSASVLSARQAYSAGKVGTLIRHGELHPMKSKSNGENLEVRAPTNRSVVSRVKTGAS